MKVPPFGEIDLADQDRARFAAMSPSQRLALFCQLCDLTDAIQAGRPNRSALRAPQERSAEALALWKRLMRRGNEF